MRHQALSNITFDHAATIFAYWVERNQATSYVLSYRPIQLAELAIGDPFTSTRPPDADAWCEELVWQSNALDAGREHFSIMEMARSADGDLLSYKAHRRRLEAFGYPAAVLDTLPYRGIP